MRGSGGEHGLVRPQDGRADFPRRTVIAAAIRDAAFLRRTLQVNRGVAVGDPFLQGRDVAFRVRIGQHIYGKNGTVGHQGPTLFGVPVGLTRRSHRRPGHGGGIQFRHLHSDFLSH